MTWFGSWLNSAVTASLVPESGYPGIRTTWQWDPATTHTGGVSTTQATKAPSRDAQATRRELRRDELGRFLRTRRERITPDQVGLPNGGRRRTPGLRREEVAQLAGVGISWYTWLEQARDVQPSAAVLDAIARALLLDQHERRHLFLLAGTVDPAGGGTERDANAIPPEVRSMLAQVEPYPAVVQSARFDLLAYNTTYRHLVFDLDAIPLEDRNLVWLAFCNRQWQDGIFGSSWAAAADRIVAHLRAAYSEHVGDSSWKWLINRLKDASPEFAQRWERHDIAQPDSVTKTFANPIVGPMTFSFTHLWLSRTRDTRLAIYVPVDDDTRAALDRFYESVAGT